MRAAANEDPDQPTVNSLSREQFRDHLPKILDAFDARLEALAGREPLEESNFAWEKSQELQHGAQRWHQGYRLEEIAKEWGQFQLQLTSEIQDFASQQSQPEWEHILTAHREAILLVNSAIAESVSQFMKMEQTQARDQVRALENALEEIGELEKQRSDLIRQAVHDLGGNVQTVSNAASLLAMETLPDLDRVATSGILRRGVQGLKSMLGDLMSLARLESGMERPKITTFDVASLLSDLCKVSGPVAREKGLELIFDGEAPLMVTCDADKVRRIAQNLLLNALKYTPSGKVSLRWGADPASNRWWFVVEDTGPGFPNHEVLDSMENPLHQPGEGIGLTIVKRLCDLLDGFLEVESVRGRGTTCRVVLPSKPQIQ